jgi:hypothetical protein
MARALEVRFPHPCQFSISLKPLGLVVPKDVAMSSRRRVNSAAKFRSPSTRADRRARCASFVVLTSSPSPAFRVRGLSR